MGLLETLAAQRGGLFVSNGNAALEHDLSVVTDLFLNFVEGINGDYTPQGAKGIQARAGFYCDEAFSACSIASEDEDAFGISIGAYAKLQWFFTQALKNGLLVLENPKDLERSSVSVSQYSLSDELNGLSEFSNLPDHKRQQVTNFSQMGCLLLLQHELAHLWNGHAGLAAAHAQGKVNKDIWPDPEDGIDKVSHLLELDADSRASHATLLMACPGILIRKGARIVYNCRLTHDDMLELRIINNIVCTYIVMRFTHYLSSAKNPIGLGSTHPPSLSRIWWHLDILRHHICLHGNIPFDQFDAIYENALFIAEQAFQLIVQVNDDLIPFRESHEFATANRRGLLAMWPKLSAALEEYRRGASLPKLLEIDASMVPPIDLPSIIDDAPPIISADRSKIQITLNEDHLRSSTSSGGYDQESAEFSCSSPGNFLPRFFGIHATDLQEIASIPFAASRHIDRIKHACRPWPFEGPLTKRERKKLDRIRKSANGMRQSIKIILSAKNHNELIAPWENFLREFHIFFRIISKNVDLEKSPYSELCISTIFSDDVLRYVQRCAEFISGLENGNVNDLIVCDYASVTYEDGIDFHGIKMMMTPMTTYALPVMSEKYPVFTPKRLAGVSLDQDKSRVANIACIAMSFVDAIISGFEQLDT